jgi:hypothetical protein
MHNGAQVGGWRAATSHSAIMTAMLNIAKYSVRLSRRTSLNPDCILDRHPRVCVLKFGRRQ